MERTDLFFKRACQLWHDRFGRCVKEENAEDAETLRGYVEQQLVAWKRHHTDMRTQLGQAERMLADARKKEASARSRLQVLGHLHAFMKQSERKLHAMLKAAAKQQTDETMEAVAEESESERPGGDDGHQEK